MKTFEEYINEADACKPVKGFIEDRDFFIAYKLCGIAKNPKTIDLQKFSREIENNKGEWKKGYVGAKRKKYKSAVNAWVKDVEPSEYLLITRPQTPTWSSDTLEVWYKK